MDALLQALGRDLLGAAVGLHPLGQRPRAAERLVEPGVRLLIAVRIAFADLHVEIGVDLVDEADGLPGELPSGTSQRAQMGAEVVGARVVEARRAVGARHVRQLGEQPVGLPGQVSGVGSRFGCNGLPQRGVTGEGVDVAFLDPVEPQAEQQIFADQGAGVHSDHANCKT